MTNRHTLTEQEVKNLFSCEELRWIDENEWASIRNDAYQHAYDMVDYDTIFTKLGLPNDTEVWSDEFGLGLYPSATNDEGLMMRASELLSDAYFELYKDEMTDLIRVQLELRSD